MPIHLSPIGKESLTVDSCVDVPFLHQLPYPLRRFRKLLLTDGVRQPLQQFECEVGQSFQVLEVLRFDPAEVEHVVAVTVVDQHRHFFFVF